jgi:hypothetical protein
MIDWFEPVEFEDGTQIARVDVGYSPGGVKVWPVDVPAGYPTAGVYPDPVVSGMVVRNDGFPTLKDWDDAVPMVVQKVMDPPGWGIF